MKDPNGKYIGINTDVTLHDPDMPDEIPSWMNFTVVGLDPDEELVHVQNYEWDCWVPAQYVHVQPKGGWMNHVNLKPVIV